MSMCAVLSREDLATNPLFADNAARVRNRVHLNAELGQIFASRNQKEWVELLSEAVLLQAAVNDFDDLLKDPGTGLTLPLVSASLSESGTTISIGNPVSYDHTFPTMQIPPPRRGQHSVEILVELGYTDRQIQDLLSTEVVATPA
jgi:formyl-CoA transferase